MFNETKYFLIFVSLFTFEKPTFQDAFYERKEF